MAQDECIGIETLITPEVELGGGACLLTEDAKALVLAEDPYDLA